MDVSTPAPTPASPAAGTPAPQQQAQGPAQVAKHKVTVDGVAEELTLDEIIRDYQTAKHATQKLQKASQIEREAKAIIDALHKGDLNFVKKSVPKDVFKRLATDYLLEEMEYDALPDHEKEKRKLQSELDQYKTEAEKRKSQEKSAAQQKLVAQAEAELSKDIESLVIKHKEAGLPIDHGYLARAVDLMAASYQGKGTKLSVAEAFTQAKQEMEDFFSKRTNSLKAEDLMKVLTKEQLKGLNQLLIQNAKTELSRPTMQKQDRPVSKKRQPISINEAFNRL